MELPCIATKSQFVFEHAFRLSRLQLSRRVKFAHAHSISWHGIQSILLSNCLTANNSDGFLIKPESTKLKRDTLKCAKLDGLICDMIKGNESLVGNIQF